MRKCNAAKQEIKCISDYRRGHIYAAITVSSLPAVAPCKKGKMSGDGRQEIKYNATKKSRAPTTKSWRDGYG